MFPVSSGPVAPLTFTYGAGEAGNTYSWTLNVFISAQIVVTTRLTVSVAPPHH